MPPTIGGVTIDPQGQTLTVSITPAAKVYTDAAGTTLASFPATVTSRTSYWMTAAQPFTVSVKTSQGNEIADATGNPLVVDVQQGVMEGIAPVIDRPGPEDVAQSGTYALAAQTLADDNAVHRVFTVTPASRAPFTLSQWSSGPQTDGTYNHWTGFGFNDEVHAGLGQAADAAIYTAFEDGWYDPSDATEGSEWYVATWSPAFADGTRAVQLFRPFYTRVNRGTVATTVAAGSNGVNVSTFAGAGTLNVASTAGFGKADRISVATSGGTAVIQYSGLTATTFTGCTLISGTGTLATGGAVSGYTHRASTFNDIGSDLLGNYNVSAGGFATIFTIAQSGTQALTNTVATINAPSNAAILNFQTAGASKWQLNWNPSAGFFQIFDAVNNRSQVKYTAGASSSAAATEFQSQVQGDDAVFAQYGVATQVKIGLVKGATVSGIEFQQAEGGSNLYRSSAGGLKSDGFFQTVNGAQFGSSGGWTGACVVAVPAAISHIGFQVTAPSGQTADLINAQVNGVTKYRVGAAGGPGFFGHAAMTAQAATPTTLADVIAILQSSGLAA